MYNGISYCISYKIKGTCGVRLQQALTLCDLANMATEKVFKYRYQNTHSHKKKTHSPLITGLSSYSEYNFDIK